MPNEYSETGDTKFFSRAYNNLAVLVFYCRLQLIQYFLTNSLVPPPAQSYKFRRLKAYRNKFERDAACWCQKVRKNAVSGEICPQMPFR
jgi:hypothetical protein